MLPALLSLCTGLAQPPAEPTLLQITRRPFEGAR